MDRVWPVEDGARERLVTFLIGEDRATTRRALLLAGVYVVGLAVLEYFFLLGPDFELVDALWRAFVLEPNLSIAVDRGTFGAVLVVGLAAIHAYLNKGYLVSVILASAPIFGAGLWSLGSMEGVSDFYLDLASAVRRTFPEAVLFATVGFVLGIGVRWLRRRLRESREPHPSSS